MYANMVLAQCSFQLFSYMEPQEDSTMVTVEMHPDALARQEQLKQANQGQHPRWRELRTSILTRHPDNPHFSPLTPTSPALTLENTAPA